MKTPKRRDVLMTATKAAGAVCVAGAIWPIIKSFGTTADQIPQRYETYDLKKLEPGQQITLSAGGFPYILRYLTAADLRAAENVPLSELRDRDARNDNFITHADDFRFLSESVSIDKAATAENRLLDPKKPFLFMQGVCTRGFCALVSESGDFGAWFCPCEASHYDTVGRIRKGGAPQNLHIPKAHIDGDTLIFPHPLV